MPGQPHTGRYDLGAALSWSFSKFGQNAATFIVPPLLVLIAGGVLYGVFIAIMTLSSPRSCGYSDSCAPDLGAGAAIGMLVTFVVFCVVVLIVAVGLLRAALGVARGEHVSLGTVFGLGGIGTVVLTAILLGIGGLLGTVLCIIPALALSIFAQFSLCFVLDQGQGPIQAIRSSINLVKQDFGQMLLFWLVAAVIETVGYSLCGIGLLVAWPVAQLATAYTYRRMIGQPVPA